MNDFKEIIVCIDCRTETDSWDWVHDLDLELKFGVCMPCIEQSFRRKDEPFQILHIEEDFMEFVIFPKK